MLVGLSTAHIRGSHLASKWVIVRRSLECIFCIDSVRQTNSTTTVYYTQHLSLHGVSRERSEPDTTTMENLIRNNRMAF